MLSLSFARKFNMQQENKKRGDSGESGMVVLIVLLGFKPLQFTTGNYWFMKSKKNTVTEIHFLVILVSLKPIFSKSFSF